MLELITHYIIPNIILFGSLYGIAKAFEYATWHTIENFDEVVEMLAKMLP